MTNYTLHYCMFHCSRSYAWCDFMRRFTSSCVVFEGQQYFTVFVGKLSLSTNYIDNSPYAQCKLQLETLGLSILAIQVLLSTIQTVDLYIFSLLPELHSHVYQAIVCACVCNHLYQRKHWRNTRIVNIVKSSQK